MCMSKHGKQTPTERKQTLTERGDGLSFDKNEGGCVHMYTF